MGGWYLYILKCKNGNLYTGMTNNLKRRFKEHLSGRGGRYTSSFGVEKLLYSEELQTRSDALIRESQVKSWPKKRKLGLIKKGRKNV